jgi:hypothetical protein
MTVPILGSRRLNSVQIIARLELEIHWKHVSSPLQSPYDERSLRKKKSLFIVTTIRNTYILESRM